MVNLEIWYQITYEKPFFAALKISKQCGIQPVKATSIQDAITQTPTPNGWTIRNIQPYSLPQQIIFNKLHAETNHTSEPK